VTRRRTSLPPELEAFIEPRGVTRQLSAETRARVLARAARAPGAEVAPAYLRHHGDSPVPRGARPFARIAVAASVALAAGTVWGIVTLPGRSTGEVRPAVGGTSPLQAPAVVPAPLAAPVPPPPAVAEVAAAAAVPHRSHPPVSRDLFAVELALLQHAHTAYTHRDLTGALALLAEHARRFPNGRLAEEREALRVRSLLAAGRNAEAHRVAAAFATQFPRSALLQRLESEESARP